MNSLEIIRGYINANGYDGLYNPGVCGCEASDLSPGNCFEETCTPGYKVPCEPEKCFADGNCDWHIGERKV